nr:rep protein [Cressdnaviricota sp.]UOF82186.1 rep protein [Cressdnaviricota sp.]
MAAASTSHSSTCMTSRRWCFTINNPSDSTRDFPDLWNEQLLNKLKLMICQLEAGDQGTEHLQGYLETKSPVRVASLKKLLPRAHLEKARGTRGQAMLYCLKPESFLGTRWWLSEVGVLTFQENFPTSLKEQLAKNSSASNGGTQSMKQRLSQIQERLSSGTSEELELIADNEFDLWVRYYRAFEKYLLMKTEPRNWDTTVHVLQGPTGTGKSKWAFEFDGEAYWKQRSNWWDGYTKQETVVLDEFYGWLPFDLLLRLCDRYPLMVETKGGQVQFLAKTIIITTNMLPCNWYRNAYFPSFARRVNTWHILPIWGEHKQYIDYGEFLKDASDNVITP